MIECKFIKDFPKYAVGADGVVMNTNTGRYLKTDISTGGYHRITLCQFGKTKRYLLHRLVAFLFVDGNSTERNVVNHLDGNKGNNSHTNLEWTTTKGNVQHAKETGLCPRGIAHGNSKYNEEIVELVYLSYKVHKLSRKTIYEYYQLPKTFADDILYKKSWLHVTDKIDQQLKN